MKTEDSIYKTPQQKKPFWQRIKFSAIGIFVGSVIFLIGVPALGLCWRLVEQLFLVGYNLLGKYF